MLFGGGTQRGSSVKHEPPTDFHLRPGWSQLVGTLTLTLPNVIVNVNVNMLAHGVGVGVGYIARTTRLAW